MTIPGSANPLLLKAPAGGGGGGEYTIERSVRFNSADSAYLSRTPASAGNRKTWTWAGWVKRSVFTRGVLFASTLNATNIFAIEVNPDKLDVYDFVTTHQWRLETTAVFRDPSAWMHICFALDTTQATSANRAKLYVNGIQVSTFDTASYPSLDHQGLVNTTNVHDICSYGNGTGLFFNGYLADIHFIDGQALDPTSFGEFDDNGIWQPIAYSGTYGTNGFHLPFDDNSTAAALGTDTSGNSNTWTVNNISVAAGAGNDSLVDVPTNGTETDTGLGGEVRGNYCTWNPLGVAGAVPTNGNLAILSSSVVGNRISTFLLTSGKWYWEGSGTGYVGAIIGRDGAQFTGSISNGGSKSIGYWEAGGAFWDGGSSTPGTSYTFTDVIGVALDMDAGNVKFYKNNALIHNLTFGSGTVPNLSSGVYPGYNVGTGTKSADFNFGQRPFAYTAPSGFKALCTANLPAPVVTKPSEYMDVALYTGNGTSQTISGLEFSPDLVWVKNRAQADNHKLLDTVRGATEELESNTSDAEVTNADGLTAFNSDGFDLGADAEYNTNTEAYVAWTWDAGSSTVTNTDGSITSTVRANPSAGFSIVTYTGNGIAGTTIGHNLNDAPAMYIVKDRDSGNTWYVYHKDVTTGKVLILNFTSAENASSFTNGTEPTSSVFSLGSAAPFNGSGNKFVAYCFAPVDGYSAFGSYTGNGSTDGPFVFTNHRPRWILFKRSNATSSWIIIDTAREGYNVDNDPLYPNLSNAEGTTDLADILSNGFKLRSADASVNANAGTYIFASFAEQPFPLARAR